ncbi:MAG: zinc metalloprotease HtpX [Candidatus Harrisonbacteria bacterium RIFCSPLOWO2_02_FULL_41_11]|uniref:Protease HtpX homolog n=1 Tax=Candidatus Harrisonbacteria bacterium RIFCSPHIGHO2_02_FULL_42_16 TaxID=1798404 RepID=A0A1G1ZF86_9BACT|nr:MAG: zinc metalloprotease HtpX [Candidatus Harrisonbacteria bacterium RIFCSPHIGHO2_02_FULL_42_16]OGY66986.1 MAG: zinc metalloprotease HtpX [Candidatus Harrisonbacteria bacterium RIFCSPLOWO2_02_FULL_41_11]
MNLYTHKDSNIRKTWLIFTLFLIAAIGIGWTFTQIYGDPAILYVVALFSVGMSLTSYWYSDKIVLKMADARPISKENARELYNIVENLSITAGLPTPKIYIINEPAPNAFATGRNPEHAVVAVTAGLLERLDRSELEGVIAHELSHIGNWDMLVSTMAVVLVGFISIASDFFMRSMFWGRRRNDKMHPAILLIGILLAVLAPIGGMLMQLAISRKREFLADASGALLTRYPDALASALIKISSDPTPLNVANNTTSHLWFDDPFDNKKQISFFHKLFMTHPPVEERVKALRGLKI